MKFWTKFVEEDLEIKFGNNNVKIYDSPLTKKTMIFNFGSSKRNGMLTPKSIIMAIQSALMRYVMSLDKHKKWLKIEERKVYPCTKLFFVFFSCFFCLFFRSLFILFIFICFIIL